MALKSGRVGIHPSQVDPITGMLINVPTPGNISFEDLSDAQIANPEVGQTLIYNGTGWENEFSSISPTTLAALQDVQITDPEDGDYLMYDSENSKWINSGEAPAPTYTDITVTMHGAVEDTISFTDGAGISHSEVFASGQSSKSVTFKINPSGSTSITFTSAVAKDPDNLSNDYAKTISVTSATTSIYVRPDKSLYWWGYESAITTEGQTNAGTISKNSHNISITSRKANSYTIAQVSSQDAIDLSANSKICAIYNGSADVAKGSYDICFTGYVNSTSEFIEANSTQTGLTVALAKGEYTVTSSVSKYPCFGCAENATTYLSALWYE